MQRPRLSRRLLPLVALAALTPGCFTYYAGSGYASRGSAYASTTRTTSTTVVAEATVIERRSAVAASAEVAPTVVVGGGADTRWATDGSLVVPGSVVTVSADADASLAIEASARMAGAAGGQNGGTSREAGLGAPSLGALVGAGVVVDGQIARLGDLASLAAVGSDGATTLYADGHLAIRASLAHEALPATGGATSVVVEVAGLAPPAVRPPLRVHLVVDASTSMEGSWSGVLRAAEAVLGQLRPQDELQIVLYGTGASEVLPPIPVGDKVSALRVIRGLRCGGRTNIEAGLRLAYGAVREQGQSLVILVSDGVPQGGLSGAPELAALAAEAHTRAGATTLAIGLGAEFHTGILAALGEAGGGDFRIAPRANELQALLETELARRAGVVATGLEATIEAAPGVVIDPHAPLAMGAVIAGETRRFVVPMTTTHAGAVAHVRVQFTGPDGRPLELEAALQVAPGAEAVPLGEMGVVLDASLARALTEAGRAIESGDGSSAAAFLEAYVALAEVTLPGSSPLAVASRARNAETLRIASTLPGLVSSASWGERRRAGAAFVEWAFGIGR